MWKKVLWLIAGILAIVMIVSGVITAVSADDAQSGPAPHGGPGGFGAMLNDNVTARVAAILGIDQSKLSDAFKQAEQQLGTERTNAMFAQLVADGKLTQAQADSYLAWLAAKPADVPMFFGSDNVTRDTDMLNRLLKDGKLTQAQFDSATAWLASKPAITLPKPQRPANSPAIAPKSWTDRSTAMLDQLLKDGRISQSTYDAYKAWYAQKPSVDLPGPAGHPGGAPPPPPSN